MWLPLRVPLRVPPADTALPRWLPGLAPLRGLAALSVAAFHVSNAVGRARLDGGPLRDVVQAGYVGVDLFFVLSGLVLFLPVCRSDGRLGSKRAFWVRRLARVYPLYLLVLVVAVLLHSRLTTASTPLPPSSAGWQLLGAHLTFTEQPLYGFFPALTGLGVNTVVWTLSVEAAFYLVLPFVARAFWRHPVLCLVLALSGSRGWAYVGTHLQRYLPGGIADPTSLPGIAQAQTDWTMQFPTYVGHFAVGMALAVLLVRSEGTILLSWLRRLAPLTAGIGLLLLVVWMRSDGRRTFLVLDAQWDHQVVTWRALPGIALLVLGTACASGRFERALSRPPAQWLGETSYAFYLFHYPTVAVLQMRLHVPQDQAVASFLILLWAVPLALLLAGVVHPLYEVPARRVVLRLLGRSRRPVPPVSARAPAAASAAPAPAPAGLPVAVPAARQ